jgi:hypothetical protein
MQSDEALAAILVVYAKVSHLIGLVMNASTASAEGEQYALVGQISQDSEPSKELNEPGEHAKHLLAP